MSDDEQELRKRHRHLMPGVKTLSTKVLDLLKERVITSYNEISEILVNETMMQVANEKVDQAKLELDISNMKRRIYDILNVLVAMRILKKEKKQLIYLGNPSAKADAANSAQSQSKNEAAASAQGGREKRTGSGAGGDASDREDPSAKRQKQQYVAHFNSTLDQLNKTVKKKREQLSVLLTHHLLVDALIQQNAANPFQAPEDQMVHLPFVAVFAPEQAHVDLIIGENSVTLSCDKPIVAEDDAEILSRMGLLKTLSAERIREVVPAEMLELLPQEVQDRLTWRQSDTPNREVISRSDTSAIPCPISAEAERPGKPESS